MPTPPADPQHRADALYAVVVNHEGQHAIWPVNRTLPNGWTATGWTGSREECLAYLQVVGSDSPAPGVRVKLSPGSSTGQS
jgi:MbtH protein